MIAVIAPEPVSWLGAVVEAAARAGDVRVLAPWALPAWSSALAGVAPGPAGAFARRRTLKSPAALSTVPGWSVAEAALRVWARDSADRTLRARFALRRAVDRLAAAWLRRLEPRPRVVIAASCAAERTFAVAYQRGAIRVLFEDLPAIRQLHADLDAAAAMHPSCSFLGRYRAPGHVIARQEAERVLADHLVVRGTHARAVREQAGFSAEQIIDWIVPVRASRRAQSAERQGGGPRVLLAGLAAARHGTMEALEALSAMAGKLTLLVRPGEGMEPRDLLARPSVQEATPKERSTLAGVDAVLAPAWCEAYLPEVALAAAQGVPVIATLRASGFVEPSGVIEPGDTARLAVMIDAMLRAPRPARPLPGLRTLDAALPGLMSARD